MTACLTKVLKRIVGHLCSENHRRHRWLANLLLQLAVMLQRLSMIHQGASHPHSRLVALLVSVQLMSCGGGGQGLGPISAVGLGSSLPIHRQTDRPLGVADNTHTGRRQAHPSTHGGPGVHSLFTPGGSQGRTLSSLPGGSGAHS